MERLTLRVTWSTPGTGTPWALWRRGCGRHGGLLCRSSCLVRTRRDRCRDGRRGRRGRDTDPPRLTRLEPLQGGHPERLGPTKGRTITLLAQLRGKRVNGLHLFREQPDLYRQFHTTAESSWWWCHPSRLLFVVPC